MIREKLKNFIDSHFFHAILIKFIIFNSIIIGLLTFEPIKKEYQDILFFVDNVLLFLFSMEVFLRFIAYGFPFFKNGWNWFDLIIISVSWWPSNEIFSVFRFFLVLRLLLIFEFGDHLNLIIKALFKSIPRLLIVSGILLTLFYIFSVLSAHMFGEKYPDIFGDLEISSVTMFQLMICDEWITVIRRVMEGYHFSYFYFFFYNIVMSMMVINLFVGVIVNSMEHAVEKASDDNDNNLSSDEKMDLILKELQSIREGQKKL